MKPYNPEMELTPLRYFLLAADTENFTRAAEKAIVTQPTLSRAIQSLEAELGQPLFEREGRKVTLTDTGKLLESKARRILGLVDDARNEITDDGETGRVRVTAIPTIAPYFLPSALGRFAKTKPQAKVTVNEDVTEEALKRLRRGEVDLAILALPISETDIDTETLFDEELMAVFAAGSSLAVQHDVSLADLSAATMILLGEGHCLSDQIVSLCRRRSVNPVSVERASQLATIQELVAIGHGCSLIPKMAAVRDTSPDRVYRSLSGDVPKRSVAVAWNPYRFESRLISAFRQILRQLSENFTT